MTASLKDFFTTGLAMENAREDKEKAGGELRLAASRSCPTELGAFDQAKSAYEAAVKKFGETWMSLDKQAQQAGHEMLHARGGDCGDEKCPLRFRAPVETAKSSGGLN